MHQSKSTSFLSPQLPSADRSCLDVVNGYRAPHSWNQETKEEIDLGTNMQKLTSNWRSSSTAVKEYTTEQVVNDARSVAAALKNKITQTTSLRDSLEAALREVNNELAQLATHRGGLEGRLMVINTKLEISRSRTQVRNGRPNREKTMDNVEHDLLAQQSELVAFGDRCKRAIALVDKAMTDLDGCRQKLEADLKDKQHAIEVDMAVLHVRIDGADGSAEAQATALRRMSQTNAESGKTPYAWVRQTEENLQLTNKLLAEAVRLRKAVDHSVSNSRALDHMVAASLNRSMMAKLQSTQALRRKVALQLEAVRAEESAMQSQRAALFVALEAKRGPLEQAKARWALRRVRTDRETVLDTVEAALSTEIAHLNAATQSLMAQVAAADRHLEQLAATIAMLKANLEDKDASIRIDETVVLLDGRTEIGSAAPSSPPPSNPLRRIAAVEDVFVPYLCTFSGSPDPFLCT